MTRLLIIAALATLTACSHPHRLTPDRDATGSPGWIKDRLDAMVDAPGTNEGEGFNP